MTDWLLDTNVLSEMCRPRPYRNVVAFIERQSLQKLFVSSVSLAEIRYGIERLDEVTRRAELNDWLTHRVRPMFAQRVLPVSEDVMFRWRLLVQHGRKQGHTFSQPDVIIAATALHHGLTIVSRETKDYEKAQAPVVNPWMDLRQ